ncbi:MAG: hypothetical protein K2J99_00620 [Lachnospiraceae bacterium]|nr:hypothetical protein [Lachnospiraceae bacterium]
MSYFKRIVIPIVLSALFFVIYPFCIRWIAGNYAKKIANVLNSHDMEKYDNFFSEDTVFKLNDRQIKYVNAKENMVKVQTFTSSGSYGHLEEYDDFRELFVNTYIKKEYTVSLMLPISDYQKGDDIVHVGTIEGEMVLKRKWLFFFDIEQVTFYGDGKGFIKEFIGV